MKAIVQLIRHNSCPGCSRITKQINKARGTIRREFLDQVLGVYMPLETHCYFPLFNARLEIRPFAAGMLQSSYRDVFIACLDREA